VPRVVEPVREDDVRRVLDLQKKKGESEKQKMKGGGKLRILNDVR
jgi:hypothetical protein